MVGLLPNVACIIQARLSSKRLPGKIALDLYGKPILQRVVDQCRVANCEMDIIVATSTSEEDSVTANIGQKSGANVVRGELDDVRQRFLIAGKGYDYIVRVTADNPFTEPSFIIASIEKLTSSSADYISVYQCPYGTGIQVFSYELLEEVSKRFKSEYDREHVLCESSLRESNEFKCEYLTPLETYRRPDVSLTVDSFKDYVLATNIFRELDQQGLENSLCNTLSIYDEVIMGLC